MKRYTMHPTIVHHAMSGHGGDPDVEPAVTPYGEWVRFDDIVKEVTRRRDAYRKGTLDSDQTVANALETLLAWVKWEVKT